MNARDVMVALAARVRARPYTSAAVVASLAVLGFHYRALLPGNAFVGGDLDSFSIPVRAGLLRTLADGEWPFWQRGMFLGSPLLGDPQIALFDPITWPTWLLSPARGLTLGTLAHLVLAATGMVFWLKQRERPAMAGLFAALAFALSLKQTAHFHHWGQSATTCAWPWMLAGLDGFARTGRGRMLALTAGATAFCWYAGSPQLSYFGTGVAGLYALWLAPSLWRRRRSDALLALAAAPLGVLLALPLILPAMELGSRGPRSMGLDYRFLAEWSWEDRRSLLLLLFPRLYGAMPAYHGPWNFHEMTGYVGLLPLALVPFAGRRRGHLLFAALAVLGVWLSFGASAWLDLHRLATRHLPGYGSFRVPTRGLLLSLLAVSLLGAEGLARLIEEPRAARRLLASLAALALAVGAARPWASSFGDAAGVRSGAIFAVALLGLAAAAAALSWWRRAAPLVPALLAALLFADLYYQGRDAALQGHPIDDQRLLAGLETLLPAAPAPRRVGVIDSWGPTLNAPFARGWEGVAGYTPTQLQPVRELLAATTTGSLPQPTPIWMDYNVIAWKPDGELSPLLGADIIVARVADPSAPGGSGLRPFRPVRLPRVYWVGGYEVGQGPESSAALRRAARGDRALLRAPLPEPSGPFAGPVAARPIEVRANSLRAQIDVPADGLLVILDPYFPGWSATLDGRPAPLLPANHAFEAVQVRKGRHQLELRYFPRMLLPGVLGALLAAASLWAALRWRRRTVPLSASQRSATPAAA